MRGAPDKCPGCPRVNPRLPIVCWQVLCRCFEDVVATDSFVLLADLLSTDHPRRLYHAKALITTSQLDDLQVSRVRLTSSSQRIVSNFDLIFDLPIHVLTSIHKYRGTIIA